MNKCRKIIIGLKKLKIQVIKREKKKREEGKNGRKKENSTEWQKPSVDAEVYSNNKKCD